MQAVPALGHSALSVIAMGGNSLLVPSQPPTVPNQFAATREATGPVAELIERGERLVITHGNGPQVGYMLRRSDLASGELHRVPLDSLVADSQGAIGYMIERSLREHLAGSGRRGLIGTVLTFVEVDGEDPAFANPTKPVGSFYGAEEAARLRDSNGWVMMEDAGRGWRRVVPSPEPKRILQIDEIGAMIAAGMTVISCGGGGIPVSRPAEDGRFLGLEAVIDKDLTSALLALELGAARLLITTGVECLYADFRDPQKRRPLRRTNVTEMRRLAAEGQFPPGSMGPKVEAAIRFLDGAGPGKEVVICRPEDLALAFDGQTGTHILPG